jgi:hypothetical protein
MSANSAMSASCIWQTWTLSVWATFRESTEITVSTELTTSRGGDLGVLKGRGTPSWPRQPSQPSQPSDLLAISGALAVNFPGKARIASVPVANDRRRPAELGLSQFSKSARYGALAEEGPKPPQTYPSVHYTIGWPFSKVLQRI